MDKLYFRCSYENFDPQFSLVQKHNPGCNPLGVVFGAERFCRGRHIGGFGLWSPTEPTRLPGSILRRPFGGLENGRCESRRKCHYGLHPKLADRLQSERF